MDLRTFGHIPAPNFSPAISVLIRDFVRRDLIFAGRKGLSASVKGLPPPWNLLSPVIFHSRDDAGEAWKGRRRWRMLDI